MSDLYDGTAVAIQKTEPTSTPPRPTSNAPSLPVQLSVKADQSPVDTKPPSSSSVMEKPMSSERRASSDRPESVKRPASSVATATDQPVAKRPMPSSCERSISDGVSIMTVSTSTAKTHVTSVSVPHKRAPTFEAEGSSLFKITINFILCLHLVRRCNVLVWS